MIDPEKLLSDMGTFWFWFLFVVSYIGLVVHYFKKKIKGESVKDITNYFSEHFKTVVISVLVTLILFIAYWQLLSTGQTADILAVFSIGFLSDSFLNKYDFAKRQQEQFGSYYRPGGKS